MSDQITEERQWTWRHPELKDASVELRLKEGEPEIYVRPGGFSSNKVSVGGSAILRELMQHAERKAAEIMELTEA